MRSHARTFAFAVGVLLAFTAAAAYGQTSISPGSASASGTIYCISVSWPCTGDSDHDATCTTEYREEGAGTWLNALPLLRCDNPDHNGFYGSIFYLEPGTEYEIRLTISDPDGGGTSTTLYNVATKTEPVMPTGGTTYHVIPGSGGGNGTSQSPFQGIAAAEAVADPGDIFLLHEGDYGFVELTVDGASNNWIVWKAAGDGDAIVNCMTVADWTWIDGLYFQMDDSGPFIEDDHYTTYGIVTGLSTDETYNPVASNVNITNCIFRDFDYSIKCRTICSNWYIADNDIRGYNHPITGNLRNNDPESGEGIELKKTDGHIVCYNKITRVADGISYPRANCDIYGNDIQDTSDDGIETDNGRSNLRVWGNRLTNCANNQFTFQPMGYGPWYFVRNQVVSTRYWNWKFVDDCDDRFFVAHNTFIFKECATKYAYPLLNSFSRNNLYIAWDSSNPLGLPLIWGRWDSSGNAPGVSATLFWMTNVDYNGYDYNTKSPAFIWNGSNYNTLASFASGVGIESHGVDLDRASIFANWSNPSTTFDITPVDFVLATGTNAAVDAGAVLYNLNEDYLGDAPDLGCYERGSTLPSYGPRSTAPTYTLTVNSGSGDGDYEEDEAVGIVADAPQTGYVFDKWTGDTAYVANVNNASTTVTMPAQSVTVTATYVAQGAGAFIEASGQVVMECENYTASQAGTGSADGKTWQLKTDVSGDSGDCIQAMPNTGVNVGDGATNGPRADYQINFSTTGVYYILLRMPAQISGADDSTNVGMDGSIVQSQLANSTGAWSWRKAASAKTITTTGYHTFNLWMREDGVITDKVVLTTNSSYAPVGTDLGPSESQRESGGSTYTLTVVSGSGDGSYEEDEVVQIVADAPPTHYHFLRWTGDTAYVSNVNSSTTNVTMPAQNVTVTATYEQDPQYSLTVNSGTGDGSYYQSDVANIAADAPQQGYVFDKWTGDTAYVANVNTSSTTVTMPSANVSVTATYRALDTFVESGGMVVMETEHYSSKAAGTGAYTSYNWQGTDVAGDSGTSMQSLPNNGANCGNGSTAGPVMNFKINFATTGVYYTLIHQPPLAGSDNSINIGMDGTIYQNNFGHTAGEWRWSKAASSKTITSTGLHTLNIWMREDGYIIDKIILTTNSTYSLTGTDTGPAESQRQ